MEIKSQPLPALNERQIKTAQTHVEKSLVRAKENRGYLGTWMLFHKEMRRFISIFGQTVISPVLTTVLWFLVFGYSLGARLSEVNGVSYINFLVPGLMMMSVIMNAFMNSGFSFFMGKVHGQIVDLLVSPLTSFQIIVAYVSAGLFRGVLVGGIIWLVSALFGADTLYQVPTTLFFLVTTSIVFALSGLIAGILSREFEHVNFFPSFLLTPLIFVGGVFYSISRLPSPWDTVSLFNPILYLVNGLRYGMVGVSDVPLGISYALVVVLIVGQFIVALILLKRGRFYIN